MENSLGVRKGAWTAQEDELLKGCIEKYGEGKWHLVPLRAELNRCRKSCRLRWLNYVKPNIKRGQFTDDEVDLICRLHKLLGNRWSLIAGRLSGRTANDVKNYWNTHLRKKTSSNLTYQVKEKPVDIETIVKTKAIRPFPHTFKNPGTVSNAITTSNHIHAPCNSSFSSATQKEDDELWLENLLIDVDATNFSIIDGCEEGHNSNTNPWTQDIESLTRVGEENYVESIFAFGACFFESF